METKYVVEITETLQNRITVYAESESEAYSMVKEMHEKEELVLGAEDCVDIKFIVLDNDGNN